MSDKFVNGFIGGYNPMHRIMRSNKQARKQICLYQNKYIGE
jgi:hypothetical protein